MRGFRHDFAVYQASVSAVRDWKRRLAVKCSAFCAAALLRAGLNQVGNALRPGPRVELVIEKGRSLNSPGACEPSTGLQGRP